MLAELVRCKHGIPFAMTLYSAERGHVQGHKWHSGRATCYNVSDGKGKQTKQMQFCFRTFTVMSKG